jgi:hypothetical protein
LLEGNSPVLLDFASQALFLNGFNDDIDRPSEDRLQLAGEPIELAKIRESAEPRVVAQPDRHVYIRVASIIPPRDRSEQRQAMRAFSMKSGRSALLQSGMAEIFFSLSRMSACSCM